jgi:hypothetical protein
MDSTKYLGMDVKKERISAGRIVAQVKTPRTFWSIVPIHARIERFSRPVC